MLDENKGTYSQNITLFSEFGMSLRPPITESFLIKHSQNVVIKLLYAVTDNDMT